MVDTTANFQQPFGLERHYRIPLVPNLEIWNEVKHPQILRSSKPVKFLAGNPAPVIKTFGMPLTGVCILEDHLKIAAGIPTFCKICSKVGTDAFGVECTDEVCRFGFP